MTTQKEISKMLEGQNENSSINKINGRFLVALILSGIIAALFLFIAISEPQKYLWMSLLIAGLHIATIISVLQRKKIGRTIGIIAWIPFCAGLIGFWGLFFYIRSEKVKNTLIK